MAGNRLSAFVDSISKIAKTGEIPVLEMDAAAQEVTEEFLKIWLVSRIRHNKSMKRDIKEDTVYKDVVEFVVNLNSSFFFPRMWSEAGIKGTIVPPIENSQDVLEFVFRGGSVLHARVFGKSNDSLNASFQSMTKHICDSLAIMSDTSDNNLISSTHRAVLPTYQITLQLFASNPWLVFVYYLCRVDIYDLISTSKEQNK